MINKILKEALKISNSLKFFNTKNQQPRIIKVGMNEDGTKNIKLEEFKQKTEEVNNTKNIFKKIKYFGESETTTLEVNTDDKEEVEENQLDREIHYSDQCRIYLKAGDGGNGLHSMLKGPLFSQSKR
jgi:predicted phage tail protein